MKSLDGFITIKIIYDSRIPSFSTDNLFTELECLKHLRAVEEVRLEASADLKRARKPEKQVGIIFFIFEATHNISEEIKIAGDEFNDGSTLYIEELEDFEATAVTWIELYGSSVVLSQLELANALSSGFNAAQMKSALHRQLNYETKAIDLSRELLEESNREMEKMLRNSNALDEDRFLAAQMLGVSQEAEELSTQLQALSRRRTGE